MPRVEMFDHTADVGLRVEADSLDDLFRTAAEAMFGYVVVNLDEVHAEEEQSLALAAADGGELLVAWLNELIFRSETEHRVFSRFAVRVAEDGLSLSATIGGEPIDRDRHVLDHEIKAVTHHGVALDRTASGWAAEVILDI